MSEPTEPPRSGPPETPSEWPPPSVERGAAGPIRPDPPGWAPPGDPGTVAGPGWAPDTPPEDLDAEPEHRRLRWWQWALLAMVPVTVVAGGIAVFLVIADDGLDHPDAWDPRIEDLASFVERERDLDWKHPVRVEFLDEEAFEEQFEIDEEGLTDEDRQEIEDSEALLRALGLLDAGVDLLASVESAQQSGTLGFYSPDEQAMYVRGTELDPYITETVVHELVHALQDQYFDILGDDFPEEEEDRASRLDFIVEGDASRIADEYVEGYDEEEQADYERLVAEFADDANDTFEDIPRVVLESIGLPYSIGPTYVSLLAAEGGSGAVDDAIETPPASDEQVLDLEAFLAGDEPAVVDGYELAEGEEEIDRGDFGMIGLALVLSGRVEPEQGYDAIRGWAGDEFVSFRRDGTVCQETVMRMDSADDARELGDALRLWADQLDEHASLAVEDDMLRFGSCDPGDDAVAPPEDFETPLGLFVARTVIAVDFAENGASLDQSFCVFDSIVERLGADIIYAEEATADEERAIAETIASCR